MNQFRSITLTLNSNIVNYKVVIFNEHGSLSKTLRSRDDFFICTDLDYINIIATNNNTKIYQHIELNHCNNYFINFTFPFRQSLSIYTFTLTDLNYGLRLNGVLNFKSTR